MCDLFKTNNFKSVCGGNNSLCVKLRTATDMNFFRYIESAVMGIKCSVYF